MGVSRRKDSAARLRRVARRAVLALAVVAVVLSLVAAVALAWRGPTGSERQAIAAVARRTPHAGSSRVSVSHIRVSTVGPWASAVVTIYFGSEPDNAVDILHKVHGKWHNANIGTAGEWCVMPVKDQRNLGFSSSYPCH